MVCMFKLFHTTDSLQIDQELTNPKYQGSWGSMLAHEPSYLGIRCGEH